MLRSLIATTLVVILVACTGQTAEPSSTESAEPPTSSTSVTTATTTTTVQTTTTTIIAATTTTAGLEATTPSQAAALFTLMVAGSRDAIIDIIQDGGEVETVDKFVFEFPESGDAESDLLGLVLVLDVTSRWASRDNQEDGAWAITRVMSALWDPSEIVPYHELWVPPFRLTNSGTTYECSGEFMVRLASVQAGRSDWESECR